jgi:hypothetical protein
MRKTHADLLFLFLFLAAAYSIPAQESILTSYERSFIRADLAAKAGVVLDAATDERAEEFIGQLYDSVLRFSLQNADMLRNDPDFIALTLLAVRGAGTAGYKPSINTLWNIFTSFLDASTRVEVLQALSVLAQGNGDFAENLFRFIISQNELVRVGGNPDYVTLSACITALGAMNDTSTIPILFAVIRAGHPDPIPAEAESLLERMPWDDEEYLIEVIRRGDYADKLAAFNIEVNRKTYTDAERGMIAEAALETDLDFSPGNEKGGRNLREMGYAAVRFIRDLRWNRAGPLVIRHFYRVRQDYEAGNASEEQFLEAISCLGAMGSPEAAEVLSPQLGYFNLKMEQRGECAVPVVLEVVNALGNLGDKIAVEPLLAISYLSYPEPIQNAAKEALGLLKW